MMDGNVVKILDEEAAEAKAQKNIRKYVERTFSSQKIPKVVDETTLKHLWEDADQGHVFDFLHLLDSNEKQILFGQLSSGISVKELRSIKETAEKAERELKESKDELSPIETTNLVDVNQEDRARWNRYGEDLISQGKVCALVLAGGQGSRLGSPLPKGMYDIGLPSHKTLFQIHAERMVKLQQLVAQKKGKGKGEVVIPLYVMTSAATHTQTKEFFKSKEFFGLNENNVIFFQQGTLPALDFQGKVIMESKNTVFVAPDGNGGLYKALKDKGVLDDMKKKRN